MEVVRKKYKKIVRQSIVGVARIDVQYIREKKMWRKHIPFAYLLQLSASIINEGRRKIW